MTLVASSLWDRAVEAIHVARHTLDMSPDASASRAYYAAFYAVSALFALRGRTFAKHTAVEAAVHRDLIKTGLWLKELGKDYNRLVTFRNTGDYGQLEHVTRGDAADAIETAARILQTVSNTEPQHFVWPAK